MLGTKEKIINLGVKEVGVLERIYQNFLDTNERIALENCDNLIQMGENIKNFAERIKKKKS